MYPADFGRGRLPLWLFRFLLAAPLYELIATSLLNLFFEVSIHENLGDLHYKALGRAMQVEVRHRPAFQGTARCTTPAARSIEILADKGQFAGSISPTWTEVSTQVDSAKL